YPGPALVMVGSKETATAKQAAHRLAATLPHATGRVVPGQGHVWNLSAADLFSAVVRAWVTGAELPAALHEL
ncbi:MAG: alpha/beta hydrolase, partial [Anaerolineaceae bacterium]